MNVRNAWILLLASIVLLGGVAVWGLPASGDERVDLAGEARRLDKSPAPTPAAVDPADAPSADPPPAPADPPPAPAEADLPPAPGVPTALYIPALDVASSVVPTGLEPDRSMEVPPVELAGWYRHGPRPGSPAGSSVIAAHVDFNEVPGVFRTLGELGLGELVTVVDDAGNVVEYEVTERYQVDKDELPTGELFRRGGPPVLTLITCGGGFEEDELSYTDNIVVRAVPTAR